MSDDLNFTNQPFRATAAGQIMALIDAIETSNYGEVTLVASTLGVEGASPSLFLELMTGMSKDSENGWVSAGLFTAATVANTHEKKVFTGLLKYARWKVNAFAGTAVTFALRGIGRESV